MPGLQQLLRLQRRTRNPASALQQLRWLSRPNSSRGKVPLALGGQTSNSEWWVVDGEMHEIGDNIPPRERFLIPRDNIPNRRRKLMREQFMRRTRLLLRDSEHDSWCKQYMELYQELRENWERLYWDEGYSKKIAQDHANYDSTEDDDSDFSLCRRSSYHDNARALGSGRKNQNDGWQSIPPVRNKFEFDRERRMREKAFAPMKMRPSLQSSMRDKSPESFDAKRFFPRSSEQSLDPNSATQNPSSEDSEPFDVKRFFPEYSAERMQRG